jgi:hypothetical protein
VELARLLLGYLSFNDVKGVRERGPPGGAEADVRPCRRRDLAKESVIYFTESIEYDTVIYYRFIYTYQLLHL